MRDLDAGIVVEFGPGHRESWRELMRGFRDANLYQMWAYESVRSRPGSVVHMVLRRRDTVIAAAQARIARLPGTCAGIAYIRWGPMWRSIESQEDRHAFRQAVRALRNEFSYRRRLVLRLYPLAYRGLDEELATILEEEGYRCHGAGAGDRTLIMDLRAPLEEVRAALDQKWRNKLNQAERNGLELVSGVDEALFDEIAKMYGQMTARKQMDALSDIPHLKRVQRELPDPLKLRAVLCRSNGVPCAGAIFAAVGETGLYVRGATSDAGLTSSGSYLVQWAFVRWLRERGVAQYDLNGISPDGNRGTYHFKRGLAGRRGREVEFLGRFQVADSPLSAWVVRSGEWLVSRYRRGRATARSLRRGREGASVGPQGSVAAPGSNGTR